MQQRRLRLGDILDDYCPRERRITNHAVVAMIDDQVKQTRCTTCDADHPYKAAKAPAPRRRKSEGALFADVLEDARPRVLATPGAETVPTVADDAAPRVDIFDEPAALEAPVLAAPVAPLASDEPLNNDDESAIDAGVEDEWPVHRPLIRATLPRPEGQVPERKEPDFTVRRPTGRGTDGNRNGHRPRGAHRGMRHAQQGQAQGHGPSGQPARFGAPRQGPGPGERHGSGQGQPRSNHGAGRPGGPGRGPQQPGGGQGRKRGR